MSSSAYIRLISKVTISILPSVILRVLLSQKYYAFFKKNIIFFAKSVPFIGPDIEYFLAELVSFFVNDWNGFFSTVVLTVMALIGWGLKNKLKNYEESDVFLKFLNFGIIYASSVLLSFVFDKALPAFGMVVNLLNPVYTTTNLVPALFLAFFDGDFSKTISNIYKIGVITLFSSLCVSFIERTTLVCLLLLSAIWHSFFSSKPKIEINWTEICGLAILQGVAILSDNAVIAFGCFLGIMSGISIGLRFSKHVFSSCLLSGLVLYALAHKYAAPWFKKSYNFELLI